MEVLAVRGISKKEFEAIKEAAKKELGFRVSFSHTSTTKFTANSVTIKPVNRNKGNIWTAEQVQAIINFMQGHGFYVQDADSDIRHIMYRDAFWSVMKVA